MNLPIELTRLLGVVVLALTLPLPTTAQSPWSDGSDVRIASVRDESGGFPSLESRVLQLVFQRPRIDRIEILPVTFSTAGAEFTLSAIFAESARLAMLDVPVWVRSERPSGIFAPGQQNPDLTLQFKWHGEWTGSSSDTQVSILFEDPRAPATLDYAGTFSAEDPHEAAEVGVPYERRAEKTLADFRRLAGLPTDFAPWSRANPEDPEGFPVGGFPSFLVAQADGLIVVQTEDGSASYRRDGTVDPTFNPPALNFSNRTTSPQAVAILGELPDGRFLGLISVYDGWSERQLVAFSGTNVLAGEVLASLRTAQPGQQTKGLGSIPQFAILDTDGSMILEHGVRRRGCTKLLSWEDTQVTGLPSLNGERLRGTRARLYWKPAAATQFAFHQGRRSRAVRESAGSITVEVRRLGDLSETQTVDVDTADGSAHAGLDYQGVHTHLTFYPGQVSRGVTIPILADHLTDAAKSFYVRLSNSSMPGLSGEKPARIATAQHTVTIQGKVRLEWLHLGRVRVWNPPYQFNVRAFSSLGQLQAATHLNIGTFFLTDVIRECLALSTTQYAPAADYFDLDLATVPFFRLVEGRGTWGTIDEVRSGTGATTLFLRLDGVDDDTEETGSSCP